MQSELGEVLREYEANTDHLNRYFLFGLWMAICGVGSIWLGGRGLVESEFPDQALGGLIGDILLLAVGIAMMFFGLFVWNSYRSLYSQKVQHCDDGLIIDVQNVVHVFPWDTIELVEECTFEKGDSIYVVRRADGNSISINNTLKLHEELAGLIKK